MRRGSFWLASASAAGLAGACALGVRGRGEETALADDATNDSAAGSDELPPIGLTASGAGAAGSGRPEGAGESAPASGSGDATGAASGSTASGVSSSASTAVSSSAVSSSAAASAVSTGATASAAASSSSGGSGCDNTGQCKTCTQCTWSGACATPYQACLASQQCLDYYDCGKACAAGDTVCLTTCASQYPTGKQLYEDYAYCVLCVACYVDCNGLAAGCP